MFYSDINEIYLVADIWWNVSVNELIKVAEIPRADEISENLRYNLYKDYWGISQPW